MKLSDILDENSILPDLKAENKIEAIHEMVDTLADTGKIRNKRKLIDSLIVRERLGTTGIGNNVAIPHAKCKETDNLIAMFGRSIDGLEFDSLDRKQVHYIFLLIAPLDSAGIHLKALARISRLLKNDSFRGNLLKGKDKLELYDLIIKEDSKYM